MPFTQIAFGRIGIGPDAFGLGILTNGIFRQMVEAFFQHILRMYDQRQGNHRSLRQQIHQRVNVLPFAGFAGKVAD